MGNDRSAAQPGERDDERIGAIALTFCVRKRRARQQDFRYGRLLRLVQEEKQACFRPEVLGKVIVASLQLAKYVLWRDEVTRDDQGIKALPQCDEDVARVEPSDINPGARIHHIGWGHELASSTRLSHGVGNFVQVLQLYPEVVADVRRRDACTVQRL